MISPFDTRTLLGFVPKRRAELMTLGVALRGTDFVVLGADRKRTTDHLSDATTSEYVNKIEQIGKRAGLILAGTDAGRPPVHDALEGMTKEDILDTGKGVMEFGTSLKNRFRQQYIDPALHFDIPRYSLLLAGLDKTEMPKIYVLHSSPFAPIERRLHESVGANGQALYFLTKFYDDTFSWKQAALLCYFCITQTVDDKVGGGVDIAIIKRGESPVFRFLSEDELSQLEEHTKQIDQLLRKQFRK